jgi:hypothetical protein
MTNSIKLSDTQRAVLEHAIDHNNGTVAWFPPSCKGGAIGKILTSLYNKDLVTDILAADDNTRTVTLAGYEAVERVRLAPAATTPDPEVEAAVTAREASWAQDGGPCIDEVTSGIEEAPTMARGPITLAALDAVISNAEAAKPRTRENSKQAQVIAMLKRPEGATIQQICATTGWQQHTVRGTFAGAFKKKLGLTIDSTKEAGGERIYKVTG